MEYELSDRNWHHLEVDDSLAGIRADKALAIKLEGFSRVQVQKVFEDGNVRLEGNPIAKSKRLELGDVIVYRMPVIDDVELNPVPMDFDVVYEDDDIIVINKAPGLVVHPGHGTHEPTMAHGLLHYTQGILASAGGQERPGIVHRLDKETSGLIIFAKTNSAYFKLTAAFALRKINKHYLALIAGKLELDSGVFQDPIGRHPTNKVKMSVRDDGRPARTDWRIRERCRQAALVQCTLYTGRTHQIRVHWSHAKHPLLGDTRYGYNPHQFEDSLASRVMLHAERLAFRHPINNEPLEFTCQMPLDMRELLEKLRCKSKP